MRVLAQSLFQILTFARKIDLAAKRRYYAENWHTKLEGEWARLLAVDVK